MKKSTRTALFGFTWVPVVGSYLLHENLPGELPLENAPQPLDYFNHSESMALSWVGGNLLTRLVAKGIRHWGSEEAKSRAGKIASSIAVGTVAAMNAAVEITEIKYGMQGAVSALTDGSYGIGGAMLGAAGVDVEGIVGKPISPREKDTSPPPVQAEPPANPDFR